jgi:hypothetical protein
MKLTWKLILCLVGKHDSCPWKSAVGGRNIRVCFRCGTITDDQRIRQFKKKREFDIGPDPELVSKR